LYRNIKQIKTMGLKYLYLPSGVKAGTAYGVMPNSADADFDDFTRNSTASRIGKNGFIESVDSNVPRLDYSDSSCPSLLLEPQRLQKIQYSEDFNQGWNASSITIGSASSISPDGTLNAFNIKSSVISGGKYIYDDNSVSTSTTYTLSGFFKKKTHDFASLLINQRTSGFAFIGQLALNIDLVNGVIDTETFSTSPTLVNSKIENYGNGWYRVSLTATTSSTGAVIRSCVGLAGSTSSFEYSGTTSDEVYCFGIQLEEGSYSTSYIPNYGTAAGVTRAADVAGGTGDLSDTFNDSEGVLMAELSRFKQSGIVSYLSLGIGDGTGSNEVIFKFRNYTNIFYVTIKSSNGTTRTDLNYTFQDLSLNTKIALKYKTNDFALWVNGYEVVTSNNANSPIGLNELNFETYDGNESFEGNTKQLQYYDTTDIDLEELTSWDSFRAMAEGQNYVIE
jgi:hypothetical protein